MATPPTPIGHIPVVPKAAQGAYATQGMVSPINQFTDGDGVLTPVSFRFLYGLFQTIQQLEQRLTNAGIP